MLNFHGYQPNENSENEVAEVERRAKHKFRLDNPRDEDVDFFSQDPEENAYAYNMSSGAFGSEQVLQPNKCSSEDDFDNLEFTAENKFTRNASGNNFCYSCSLSSNTTNGREYKFAKEDLHYDQGLQKKISTMHFYKIPICYRVL